MTEPFPTPGTPFTAAAEPAGRGDRPPPARFAYDAHTWKEIAHLLANLPVSLVGFVYAVTMLFTGAGLTVTVIGFPLLALGLMGSRLLGRLERARARKLLGVRVDEPSRLPLRGREGFWPHLWMAVRDPVGWRTVLYQLIRLPWGIATFVVTLTGLFVLWPVLPFIVRGLANADRAMVRGLLSPSDELERRIAELESDRGSWWTRRRRICGASSGICTTGRRPGWSIWRWVWAWRRRSCWRIPTPRRRWSRRRTAR
ncbi:hypothetical protein SHKM778_07840 [Streptomyces sp. KM77-8]|uniref:Putative sensor domain-containing protein n=1 Tax=Streptomyces haneummycinicus TaxID=3074435 RepID=A0AAT9HAQ8_9ACTN